MNLCFNNIFSYFLNNLCLGYLGPGDSQWVDIVESELRHILDPKLHHNIANSTLSESISSMTPPLPPLSPGGSSDEMGPAFKHKR